jgi:hypothetical protein
MTRKSTISRVSFVLSGALFAFSLSAFAQHAIPQGTTLPVRLDSSISLNSKPGARITARVMQNVPLPNNENVREGSKLVGHVIAVYPPDANGRSQVSIRFEELIASGRTIPVSTRLIALAGFMAVEQAQIPAMGPDRGTPANAWNTTQIGGDEVYRGGGPVMEGSQVIGRPTPHGVLINASSSTLSSCGGVVDSSVPRALWLFSADACGVYDIAGLTIAQTGQSEPLGQIVLSSSRDKLSVPSGSGMLLNVVTRDNSGASN